MLKSTEAVEDQEEEAADQVAVTQEAAAFLAAELIVAAVLMEAQEVEDWEEVQVAVVAMGVAQVLEDMEAVQVTVSLLTFESNLMSYMLTLRNANIMNIWNKNRQKCARINTLPVINTFSVTYTFTIPCL